LSAFSADIDWGLVMIGSSNKSWKYSAKGRPSCYWPIAKTSMQNIVEMLYRNRGEVKLFFKWMKCTLNAITSRWKA